MSGMAATNERVCAVEEVKKENRFLEHPSTAERKTEVRSKGSYRIYSNFRPLIQVQLHQP